MLPKIIVIQGPTASGKSSLALDIARHLNTEIISADSRQVYKYMNIGTAKPSQADQNKVKHHLIDIITPAEKYDAGRFCQDSKKIITSLLDQGKVPVIAGGTGLYINSLIKGIFAIDSIPPEITNKIQDDLQNFGLPELFQKLQSVDPLSASQISQNDKQRITRALEIFFFTGKTRNEHWENQIANCPYDVFNICIQGDRTLLYNRINHRVDQMISDNLILEINSLLQMGWNELHPGFNTVGYREYFQVLNQQINEQQYIDLVKQHSRNYAKRQFTWYKKQHFNLTIDLNDVILSKIIQKIENFVVGGICL